MDKRELMAGYRASQEVLDPSRPEQVQVLDMHVGRFLETIETKSTGETSASWELNNGIRVRVFSYEDTVLIGSESTTVDNSSNTYGIQFTRQLGSSEPDPENLMMLAYAITLPTENSNVEPSFRRFSPEISLDQPQFSIEQLAEWEMEEAETISQADAAMLIEALTQTTRFNQDPIELFSARELNGQPIEPKQVQALKAALNFVSQRGYVQMQKARSIPLPLDDSRFAATLTISSDQSTFGPLTGSEDIVHIYDWSVELLLRDTVTRIDELFKLTKQFDGSMHTLHKPIMDIQTIIRTDSITHAAYKKALEASREVQDFKESVGVGAFAGEVDWFVQLCKSIDR